MARGYVSGDDYVIHTTCVIVHCILMRFFTDRIRALKETHTYHILLDNLSSPRKRYLMMCKYGRLKDTCGLWHAHFYVYE